MNSLLLFVCFFSFILVANSLPNSDVSIKRDFNLILNLLPLYGSTKLERFINKNTLTQIQTYFDKNKTNYFKLKAELVKEGVFLPDISKFNLNG